MAATDIQSLRERARKGDVEALTQLGKRLLGGEGVPVAHDEAIRCIDEAARRGGPEATALLARFAGWGVLRPRDMSLALDLLQQSAERGHLPSQRELQFLARSAGADWTALRGGIDLPSWIRAPCTRTVSERPAIGAIDSFATAAECAWLIERGRSGMRRAQVYRHDLPGHTEAESRTNSESDFTIWNADLVLALIRDRIAATIGSETRFFEVTKLLRYDPGQHFGLHADFQEPATPALASEIERRGQRIRTFLVYLNSDYEGGETEFPRVGLRHRGRRGDALWFVNVDAAGAPDHQTVHAGLPLLSGTKWLLSQWIRSRPVG